MILVSFSTVASNLGEEKWGYSRNWYPIFEAAAWHLKDDYKAVEETLSPFWEEAERKIHHLKSWAAAIEGDLDLSLDFYYKSLSVGEMGAYWQIQAPTHLRIYFPNYRSHPKYRQMLKDVELDEDSIADLEIPPLPF